MTPASASSPSRSRGHRFLRGLVRILAPVLILAVGILVAGKLVRSKPIIERTAPAAAAPLVDVISVASISTQVTIHAMGTIIPSREIALRSRVSGEVVSISERFQEGDFVEAGQELLRLDPADYELAVQRAETRLVEAEYDLTIEQGRQQVAQREWTLLNPGPSATRQEQDLALRKPHRARVEARKSAAEADLKKAQLDLDRTAIRAPFNAVMQSKRVELGAQVAPQDVLATLTDSSKAWIRATVPRDRLPWIAIPRDTSKVGAPCRVYRHDSAGPGAATAGRVIRLLSEVEDQGRMAQVLIEVQDPFGLETGKHPGEALLFGSYVRVEILGRELTAIIPIPRTALRDENRVWVATTNQTLELREVSIAWREPHQLLIDDGLDDGDRLILSALSTPVSGMALTVRNMAPESLEASESNNE